MHNFIIEIAGTYEEVCTNDKLAEEIMKDIIADSKKEKLSGLEIIKKIYISSNPFTIENGILTPTFKIKRNDAKLAYLKEIEALYSSPINEPKK